MRLLVDVRNSTRVLGCKGTTRVQRCREGNVYGSRLRCSQKSWLLVLPTWVGFLQVVAKHQDEHVLQCSCFPPPRAAIAFEVDPQCQSACGRSGTFTSAPVGLWRKDLHGKLDGASLAARGGGRLQRTSPSWPHHVPAVSVSSPRNVAH